MLQAVQGGGKNRPLEVGRRTVENHFVACTAQRSCETMHHLPPRQANQPHEQASEGTRSTTICRARHAPVLKRTTRAPESLAPEASESCAWASMKMMSHGLARPLSGAAHASQPALVEAEKRVLD
jgi:hypothetical protein